jgi:eukaryotic-like serine/threonine-protein kinase
VTERNESPGADAAVQSTFPAGTVIQPPRAGDVFGRFVLESPLGHGAMATVFRALDTTLGRRVAIKVLNPAVASQNSGSERFRREAMAVASLRHPNIVEVYDFVPAADGNSSYLVEELIVGDTLQSLLEARGGSFIPEVAALVAAEVAEALHAAHKHGVIHRDVKPANIMIERREQHARVVLADFGVAHVGDMTTMTATGAMVCSPAYMSPEQARGQDINGTVDVWALGVLLYQMATGKLPFAGRDPITVITSICKGEYRRAAQIAPRVGPELDRIIVGCLRPIAAERFQSAQEVSVLLRACAARVDLTSPGVVVRQLLDQPTSLAEGLAPKLAANAIQNARGHIKKRQLARALAELGRATAYVPKHAEAERLINSLSSQRKWTRVAMTVGALAAITAAAVTSGKLLLSRSRKASAPVVATATPTQATTANKPLPVVNTVEVIQQNSEPAPVAVVAPATKPVARKKRVDVSPLPIIAAQEETPAAPAPERQAALVAAVAQVAPEPAPQQARVRLFARFAFCFPSLDSDNVRKAPPRVYDMVVPGAHQVFCTLTQDGPRLGVGTLQVKPGARLDVNIVPDDKGQPIMLSGAPGSSGSAPIPTP